MISRIARQAMASAPAQRCLPTLVAGSGKTDEWAQREEVLRTAAIVSIEPLQGSLAPHGWERGSVTDKDRSSKEGHMAMSAGKKAAETRRRRAAGRKAALTRRRRAAGRKAALTRKRRAAGAKAAKTRKRRAAARKAVATKRAKRDAHLIGQGALTEQKPREAV